MSVSPPRPRLPHLNSLRAFEAAARLNSIALAADELCVTPAAVAQQVKSLEAWVGDKLFLRNAKGVELTPLGAAVSADFSNAFDSLVSSVQKLRLSANPQELRIATMPSIAQLWVSPRLPFIRKTMPDLSLSVTALERPPNMRREPFDLAIFYRDQKEENQTGFIEDDVIFPVCAPAIAERLNAIADLRNEVFLHDTAWKEDWKTWLSAASPDANLSKSGPEFSLYALALEECKNGAGILIGHESLVRRQLQEGSLVAPFDFMVTLPRQLAYTTSETCTDNPVFRKVISMLAVSSGMNTPA